MKLRNICLSALLIAGISASAQMPERNDSVMLEADPWLHIYGSSEKVFNQFPMNDVVELRFNEENGQMIVNHEAKGDTPFKMSDIKKWAVGPNMPRIDIDTYNYIYEIQSKTDYVYASLKLQGYGIFPDVEVDSMRIRGRGNTTWGMPKKPYRLKFNEKTKLCGLKKAKNYVLLANYMDKSLMRNFVADKFAQLIGCEYPNHVVPVDVYLNGNYKGSYMLTEKVGINNGSVDLTKEEEANSIMFELDTYSADADELPFTSSIFGLPVRVKDPDAPEDPTELKTWLQEWKNDFTAMEEAVNKGGSAIWEAVDLDAFVRFIMVFNFCTNQEVKHPKSVFLWKVRGEKYHFGPVWDFDWAFGYDDQWSGVNYQIPLFSSTTSTGSKFFLQLVKDSTFLKRYAEIWNEFYKNHVDEFFAAFDAYADALEPSAAADATILQSSSYHSYIPSPEALRTWIEGHIEWINDPSNNYGLYNSSSQGGWGNW